MAAFELFRPNKLNALDYLAYFHYTCKVNIVILITKHLKIRYKLLIWQMLPNIYVGFKKNQEASKEVLNEIQNWSIYQPLFL